MKVEWSEQEISLPPGACATCGGEGQEQWLDGPGEPHATTCQECRGTGNAKNPDNRQIANALDAVNSWITNNPTTIGEHGIVIRDALREVLGTRSLLPIGAKMTVARQIAEEAAALLRKAEWAASDPRDGDPMCPWCRAWESTKHETDCPFVALLARASIEVPLTKNDVTKGAQPK